MVLKCYGRRLSARRETQPIIVILSADTASTLTNRLSLSIPLQLIFPGFVVTTFCSYICFMFPSLYTVHSRHYFLRPPPSISDFEHTTFFFNCPRSLFSLPTSMFFNWSTVLLANAFYIHTAPNIRWSQFCYSHCPFSLLSLQKISADLICF